MAAVLAGSVCESVGTSNRRSAELQSVGVLVIVCGSAVIIVIDCCLERIVNALERQDSPAKKKRREDDKLHLLSLTLMVGQNGSNKWKTGEWGIPVRDDTESVEEAALGVESGPLLAENRVTEVSDQEMHVRRHVYIRSMDPCSRCP